MGRFLLFGVLASCAVAPRAPSATKDAPAPEVALVAPFAVPGETMELEASIRGLDVGRVITAVGQIGWVDGRHSIIVKSRGQSTGMIALLADLTWEEVSTIDLDRGHVLASREESWDVLAGKHEHDVFTLGDEGEHDVHSAITAVRAWRSQLGQRATLRVHLGGTEFSVELTDAQHAYLSSGHQPAVRYDGNFNHLVTFSAWVSDDIARVPLRFECDLPMFGLLVIELVHYTAPAETP